MVFPQALLVCFRMENVHEKRLPGHKKLRRNRQLTDFQGGFLDGNQGF
jgi:hypothetical protein